MDLILIDGHNDLPWAHREAFDLDLHRGDVRLPQPGLHTDLPRLRTGGVNGQFWSVYVPSSLPGPEAVRLTLEQIDFVHRMVAHDDAFEIAVTADQVEAAISRGRIASLIGVEGGHAIGDSLAVLRQLHRLGARYLTLTHNDTTSWADSATDRPAHEGLSPFGAEVVRQLNDLGMMVDLSHVADATMHGALDVSRAPVIFSHSNARKVCDVARNVPEDVLERIPHNGGIVMATFVSFFASSAVAAWREEAAAVEDGGPQPADIEDRMRAHERSNPPPRATIHDVVAHLEHLREAVGIDHVGLGGDFDGSDWVTLGLEDVSCYPRLFAALKEAGWSSKDLESLAGRNVLRVMRDVEAAAAR